MAKTYNPKKVLCSFAGFLITGFMDGTMITAARKDDQFDVVTGGDGETARVANPNKAGTVVITLMQTSASNDALSRMLQVDEITNANTGALFVKDASGRTLVNAGEAWVKKYAEVTFGKELSGREWTIETGNLEIFAAGN